MSGTTVDIDTSQHWFFSNTKITSNTETVATHMLAVYLVILPTIIDTALAHPPPWVSTTLLLDAPWYKRETVAT